MLYLGYPCLVFNALYLRLIEKLCDLIPQMEPQELPPFVHHLHFLCDMSHHLEPLKHLAAYFHQKLSGIETDENGSFQVDSMEIDSNSIGMWMIENS